MTTPVITDQKRLIKLIREVHAVLTENRTATLRVKVPNGIGTNTYELRLVKTEATFKFTRLDHKRPAPAKPAAPEGRKTRKGTP